MKLSLLALPHILVPHLLSIMLCALFSSNAHGDDLLSLFPPSTATLPAGETSFTDTFEPVAPGTWFHKLREDRVFQAELSHQQEPPDGNYTLRIGKGGQLYSLRGAFGESVPPSFRHDQSPVSPWNDEVWQFVSVCTSLNGLKGLQRKKALPAATISALEKSGFATSFFVHNSGAYVPKNAPFADLYCPILAATHDAPSRSYRLVSLGLVPQLKTIHRSPLLFYVQVRDAGAGVIELTYLVHNFSRRPELVFDYHNAPWGGTRISSLPHHFVGQPDGSAIPREKLLAKRSQHLILPARETGGWSLFTATATPDSPSLALVFGRDQHWRQNLPADHIQSGKSLYRTWTAAPNAHAKITTVPANAHRNYEVVEFIPKLRLKPGQTIWHRSFLVVNRRDRATELARDLVNHVDYGLITAPAEPAWQPAPAPLAGYRLLTRPHPDARPIFLIQNQQTGQRIVTTDPYHFVAKQPLNLQVPEDHPAHAYLSSALGYDLTRHNTRWLGLIGFASLKRPQTGAIRLSEALPESSFPAATPFHNDLWVQQVAAAP